jgi:uncharacterized protein
LLIQFRVENHRSLRDEQVLNLASGPGSPDDSRLLRCKGLGQPLVPVVAVYGANASGKSNVIAAMSFMQSAVLNSQRMWEPEERLPRDPFRLSAKANEPSLYEVDALVDDTRIRYGFVLGTERVEEEWLHAWPHGKKQTLFERTGSDFTFGKNLRGENETIKGLTRANSLFLSAAAQNNHPSLLPIFAWFRFTVRHARMRGARRWFSLAGVHGIFSPQLGLPGLADEMLQREREEMVRLLQAADTGIVDVRLEEREDPGMQTARRLSLSFRHASQEEERAWLPVEVESEGTVTLLELAGPILRALRHGGLICVDELESSLHPMLAFELVRMFNDPSRNPKGAQLIFTTHDTNLLGSVLGEQPLRRDQVWFTEKDSAGATQLYALTDFHPRKEENLERGYLQGRYGAVPFLGSLQSLLGGLGGSGNH